MKWACFTFGCLNNGWQYALAKYINDGGIIYRSRDGLTDFEEGPRILPRVRHKGYGSMKVSCMFSSPVAEMHLNISWYPELKTWMMTGTTGGLLF
jgi:hypothetical protein